MSTVQKAALRLCMAISRYRTTPVAQRQLADEDHIGRLADELLAALEEEDL